MNKTELVEAVAERSGAATGTTQQIVQAVLDEITATLSKGEDVSIPGFGKFSTADRAARTGVNPRDPSQTIEIAARRVPRFTAGAGLKTAVSA